MPAAASAATPFELCVELAALAPAATVAQFVAEGHARIAGALGCSAGFAAIGSRTAPPEGDPLLGWRIAVFYEVGPRLAAAIEGVERALAEEAYLHDPVVQGVVRDAGRHRVYHDPDPRTDPDRARTLDAAFWQLHGLVDRLKLVYTVSPDVEIHMSADRVAGSPRFDDADAAFLEEVMRGLGPWARRVTLLHGHLAGHAPLSPRERAMACALLGHAPLKQIADGLEISEARARELVRGVYRKLAVGTRAELASLWAGAPPRQPRPVVTHDRPQRRRASGERVRGAARAPRE